MKWIYVLPIFLFACSQPNKEAETQIIYQTDTVYVEVESDEVFPWDLSCGDTANTQADMNICAGRCFHIADSLNSELFETTLLNLKDRIQTEDNLIQREKLFSIHNRFIEIRELSAEYMTLEYGEGSMMPTIRLTTKTWITEFEYQLLRSFNSNILEG